MFSGVTGLKTTRIPMQRAPFLLDLADGIESPPHIQMCIFFPRFDKFEKKQFLRFFFGGKGLREIEGIKSISCFIKKDYLCIININFHLMFTYYLFNLSNWFLIPN